MCLVIEGACGLLSFDSVHPKEWNEFDITARIFALSQKWSRNKRSETAGKYYSGLVLLP